MLRKRAPISDGGEQLLRELVESVPVATAPYCRPVALRSVALQRRQALADYGVRTRLDRVLLHAEWLVVLFVVLVVGAFAARPIVDEWRYPRPVQAAPAATLQPMSSRPAAQSLPAQTLASAHTILNERAVEPWDFQTPRDAVRDRHPELGLTLPSSTLPEQTDRELDYIQPHERYARRTAAPGADAATEAPAAPIVTLPPVYLEAPGVGIQADAVEVFLQDGIWQVADFAVGYLSGTGQPGVGNLVMAGHKGIRGAVFANLEALQPGDEIFVDTAEQRFRYQVRETRRVWPSEVEVMYPTSTPTLTLLTCTNWDLQRFVVIADLVDSGPRVDGTGG